MTYVLSPRTVIAVPIILAVILECSHSRKYVVPHPISDNFKNKSVSQMEMKMFGGNSSVKNTGNLTSAISIGSEVHDYYNAMDNSNHYANWHNKEWQGGAGGEKTDPVILPSTDNNYNYDTRLDQYHPGLNHYNGYMEAHFNNDRNHRQSNHAYNNYNEDLMDFAEIEHKVFAKTLIATKLLKIGKVVFVFCMVLIVLILAGIAKSGIILSPVALPLTLIPLGIIALLLFIPLFVLLIPLVAASKGGHHGPGRERRRMRQKRNAISLTNLYLDVITGIDGFLLAIERKMKDASWSW